MSRIANASLRAASVAGTLAAAGAIAGGAVALGSVPTASAARTKTVTIVDCAGHAVAHPRSFVLACGDGDTTLARLRWRDWGAASASATATELLDLCEPDCADGRTARFPVTVDAQRVRDGRYTRLVVHAGRRRPRGVPATESWTPERYR